MPLSVIASLNMFNGMWAKEEQELSCNLGWSLNVKQKKYTVYNTKYTMYCVVVVIF